MKTKTLSWLLISGVMLLVLIYAALILYFTWPINELSMNKSGTFGDSFGLLTSLFSGLAFAGLIITIVMQKDQLQMQSEELVMQRKELELTREVLNDQRNEMQAQNKTMQIQRFENTFFNMLEVLDSCRKDITFSKNNAFKGNDAIENFYNQFKNSLFEVSQDNPFFTTGNMKEEFKGLIGINEGYKRFYSGSAGDELGQYYRTLYNILKLIDRTDFLDEKKIYTNLVRAQLSRYELALLFYNCLSDFGKDKMAKLIKKYNILKHLEKVTLPEDHLVIWEDIYLNVN